MKPLSSVAVVVAVAASVAACPLLSFRASRSMNSNPPVGKKALRGVSRDEWRCSSRNIDFESFDRENGQHRRSVNRTFSSERVISVGRLDCTFESEESDPKLNVEESEKLLIEMISDGLFLKMNAMI